MSHFDHLSMLADDPIIGLTPECNADPRSNTINLAVGTYKDAQGQLLLLSSVRQAETLLIEEGTSKGYQPINGTTAFAEATQQLIFGAESRAISEGRILTVQALGGSGALNVAAEFLVAAGCRDIYVPSPTWPNHFQLLGHAGLTIHEYPYYHVTRHTVDFERLCSAVATMASGSAMLLHGCCHNPTGSDLSWPQWQQLEALLREQRVIPLFDLAYQGFGQTLDDDAAPIRLFADAGHEMIVASSYSKIMGLYGERVGAASIVTRSSSATARCGSHAKVIVRSIYSSPPIHGGALVVKVLTTPHLNKQWKEEVTNMRIRVQEMRKALVAGLATHGYGDHYRFIANERGMFSLLNLDREQVYILKKQYGIYLPDMGRVNIASLNSHNMNRFIDAFLAVAQPHSVT